MFRVLICMAALGAASPAFAERKTDFNSYILRAVEQLEKWNGKGYSAGTFYTHPLPYGPHVVPKGRYAPKTMCVGAVAEVIITAIDLYVKETRDDRPIKDLPARTWTGATRNDIRPYIWMFDTVSSNGTADALQQFGIGEQVPFSQLLPGDFIGLNRETGTGHAVVFLGYLDRAGDDVDAYDVQRVVGFKYYSAQGGRPDGLGFRWAFFAGHCPKQPIPNKPADCRIHKQRDQQYLNSGYMIHPKEWNVPGAKGRREAGVRRRVESRHVLPPDPTKIDRKLRLRIDAEVRRQLDERLPDAFDADRFDGQPLTSD